MNINYYQRSPETEQFMTAKISGNQGWRQRGGDGQNLNPGYRLG